MSATQSIARFVAGLELSAVPRHAGDIAKGGMLDALAAIVAGAQETPARIVTGWTREQGGKPVASVIGHGFKTSPAMAARANGTMQSAMDFDPPTPILPVVLAMGEATGASGRALLEAYIAGYEVQWKLQAGVSDQHSVRGWHSNTVFGTLGAAAAAGKLLGLDAQSLQMAFGIAASQACGLMQNLGTMTKTLHTGIAAANGVMAAGLAKDGFSSAPDGIEGDFGLLRVIGMPGEYDEGTIGGTFGEPWILLDKEIRIKPFPCCRWVHRAADAILTLARKHNLNPDAVDHIECEAGAELSSVMTYRVARTALEGKFCTPYCLAVALHDHALGPAQFTEERVRDAAVQATAELVVLKHPASASAARIGSLPDCIVRLHLRSGQVLEERAGPARGDRENPMDFSAIAGKFRLCAQQLIAPAAAERCIELLDHLETAPDLSELMTMLTDPKNGERAGDAHR